MKFRRALLILSIFVVLAGIHLFINTQNISLKYQANDLKEKLSVIKTKNRLLGLQIAKKENLGEIEQKAKKDLGMIYPKKVNYVLVPAEQENKTQPRVSGSGSKEATP